MSDRTAFYKAIWAAPDDDLPRLVFADWLDEAGDHDHAHFLRLLSAARTCPPDVDRLRPLVADLRRTMVTLPPGFVESACPVPPAVVVGPWVDVDHEANRGVLKWLRKNREHDLRGVHRLVELGHTHLPTWRLGEFRYDLGRLALLPERVPETAVCLAEGVLTVVHVWSGVIVVTARATYRDYVFRVPEQPTNGGLARMWPRDELVAKNFGADWTPTAHPFSATGELDEVICGHEVEQLRRTCAKFDPANHPA